MGKYPECEKLAKVSDTSNKCGEFYDWCCQKGYISNRKRFQHEKVLAEFFKVDMNKVEKERRQILEDIRKEG